MAAIATNTKNYFIGPQDGWTQIVTGAVTPINTLRISAIPHTHPFFVYAGASLPAANVVGVRVCHHPFKFGDFTNGTSSLFFVRVSGPVSDSKQLDGRLQLDVMSEGGVLS